MINKTNQLYKEVKEELQKNILPFWMNQMTDPERGGFYGQITGTGVTEKNVPKGAILNARILWTFSASYRLLGNEEYLQTATCAKRYLIDYFYDKEYGGIYWLLDCMGNPVDTKKQIYALGFAIYGLSEYYRATGDQEALEYAIRLFHDIENHSFDKEKNGYCEALNRVWEPVEDMRLSDKDMNERKTMNTHLHILEPYTNLYRVWKNDKLEKQLRNLIHIFIDYMLDDTSGHLQLFFDDDWNKKNETISYGHDIEASWLIHEAVLVLDDVQLVSDMELYIIEIAEAATEGFIPGGGMIYELHKRNAAIDAARHWWVQAEAIVGYVNLYQHFKDELSLTRAIDCWEFVKKHMIDRENGEWFWSILPDGKPDRKEDKAGFWKCPYHNGRMCLEIIERFK